MRHWHLFIERETTPELSRKHDDTGIVVDTSTKRDVLIILLRDVGVPIFIERQCNDGGCKYR